MGTVPGMMGGLLCGFSEVKVWVPFLHVRYMLNLEDQNLMPSKFSHKNLTGS